MRTHTETDEVREGRRERLSDVQRGSLDDEHRWLARELAEEEQRPSLGVELANETKVAREVRQALGRHRASASDPHDPRVQTGKSERRIPAQVATGE